MKSFKVGDWVVRIGENKPMQVSKVSGSRVNCGSVETYLDRLELWQPQEGEWCWFWNKKNAPIFGKFKRMDPSGARIYEVIELGKNTKDLNKSYKFCEPFIGELPSFIKEIK